MYRTTKICKVQHTHTRSYIIAPLKMIEEKNGNKSVNVQVYTGDIKDGSLIVINGIKRLWLVD